MKRPKLNTQQETILFNLYKFRFLTVHHFLKILNHKSDHRIYVWLKYLLSKELISRNYTKKFAGVPAVYYLTVKGVNFLRNNIDTIYKPSLRRLNREKEKKRPFINHCLFIATIYLKYMELVGSDTLQFLTEVQILKDRQFLPEKLPDAYIAISHKGHVVRRYFLKIFDDWLNDSLINKIINGYIDYSSEGDWEVNTGHELPFYLFVAPTSKIKNHIYFYTKNKLENEMSDITIFVTTNESIRLSGVKKEVWKKVS